MIANKAATISMLVLKYLISNIINNVGLLVGGYDVPIPHRHSGDSAPVKGNQVVVENSACWTYFQGDPTGLVQVET